ncbi:hypothetical protein F2P81_007556 [Scophthalmus maximus]|uniref:Uncharacterized protein n=1 Tax=Scophthalmus maximus TaxID=52904 RepID=A0A6A4T8D2_SCOMX|nr:hypothetical protein F2P81_007556 [Scophthalmus maximus]
MGSKERRGERESHFRESDVEKNGWDTLKRPVERETYNESERGITARLHKERKDVLVQKAGVIFIYSPMLISPPLKIKAYIVVKTWRGANRQHVLRVRQRHLTLLWLSTAPMEVLEQLTDDKLQRSIWEFERLVLSRP